MNNTIKQIFPDIRLRFFIIITFSVISILTHEIDFILFLYIASIFITILCEGDIFFPFRKYKLMFPFFFGLLMVHILFSREGIPVLKIGNLPLLYSEGMTRLILATVTMLILFMNSSILINIPSSIIIKNISSLKLPHSILIPLLTAFRVIPLIREKGSDKIFTLKLKNEIHSHKNFFTRLQSYRKLLLPLIVESLILARKLAVVLDLRGFRKEGSLPISRKKSITFSESIILMFLGIFFISYILFQKRIM